MGQKCLHLLCRAVTMKTNINLLRLMSPNRSIALKLEIECMDADQDEFWQIYNAYTVGLL